MSTILMEQTLNKAMKRMKEAMALACVLTMVVQSGLAQGELELDLQGVFVPQHQVKNYQQARSGGGQLPPLGLPFVDDFAWPSLYEEDAPLSAKRWELSPVRRTQTLAYRPPTIGCATLDGLDAMGNPRMLNATSPVGYSDTLTSRRLFLGATLPTDSVALSFWYQSGGIANGADAGEDSLVVEFKTGSGDDPWRWVWSTEGIANDTVFHPVVIPIDVNLYFHNDFQFRFRNYGAWKAMWTPGTSTTCVSQPKATSPPHFSKKWRSSRLPPAFWRHLGPPCRGRTTRPNQKPTKEIHLSHSTGVLGNS